jgi:hypothetical protein
MMARTEAVTGCLLFLAGCASGETSREAYVRTHPVLAAQLAGVTPEERAAAAAAEAERKAAAAERARREECQRILLGGWPADIDDSAFERAIELDDDEAKRLQRRNAIAEGLDAMGRQMKEASEKIQGTYRPSSSSGAADGRPSDDSQQPDLGPRARRILARRQGFSRRYQENVCRELLADPGATTK